MFLSGCLPLALAMVLLPAMPLLLAFPDHTFAPYPSSFPTTAARPSWCSLTPSTLPNHPVSHSPTSEMCIDPSKIDLERICPLVFVPVCGCNGVTYSNDCFAQREGVVRWTDGVCPLPTPHPTSYPEKELCIDLKNIQFPAKHRCPGKREPVCGCDGKIYKNICHAIKHGILLWKGGECSEVEGEEKTTV
jgi:hypothetical protein